MSVEKKKLPAKSEQNGDRKIARKIGDEVEVRFRPMAEFEKWLSQRVEDRSARKTVYVIAIAFAFILCVVPLSVMCLGLIIQWLNAAFATAIPAAAEQVAAANMAVLLNTFLTVTGIGIAGTCFYNSLPTHLALTKDGIRLRWKHLLFRREGNLLAWNKISRLSLDTPVGKTSPLDHILRFSFGGNQSMKFRLGCFPSVEERAKVLEAVEFFSPDLERDAAVVQALELPPDYSYTELWLQALSGPPKRERLTPIEHKATLRSGRYIVDRALGVGGQGTAYLAYDKELAENVVLKEFILPVFVDVNVRRQSLESFEKEARILRQLNHDQIVKLVDFFVEDHRGYLVLEHIDGQSLQEKVLSEGALAEEQVRGLALQMCTMQTYLHGLTPPVVHRDFTPDNLILRNDGTLKLVDFNVAQQKDTTATGTVVGKHSYLPPEQFRGQPTTQSDIYSMGASLFFILTAQDPEPINQQHPRKVNLELSEDMDRMVAKATAIDLKQRYSTAEQFAQELEESRKAVK